MDVITLRCAPHVGFTIVELAIVLTIVGLLLAGLLIPFATQVELRRVTETSGTLDQAKEALIGFAIANGRLPCPASSNSQGRESFCDLSAGACTPVTDIRDHGKCSNPLNGFFPAASVSFVPVDQEGYAVDAWGLTQNRLRYAVTEANANSFTAKDGMKNALITNLQPNLTVCASGKNITASNCGSGITVLTNTAPAVLFSLGKNAPTGGSGRDEAANLAGNRTFVSHEPTPGTSEGGEFDDVVTWLSPNLLYARLVQAGRLP
jgi:type II secretory pathway pseudopilin PulG